MSRIRIGMMSFAHMHAFSYASCLKELPDAELAGVADEDKKRGQAMAKKLGVQFFPSYAALLKENIQGVIICSENSKHKELTLKAAAAKKHILCEKPISTNMKDAKAMIASCKRHKVKLLTAFPCRFMPSVVKAKRLIESGSIGRLLAIRGTNHGSMPGGWFIKKKFSGGGAVMDHTVHVADLMRWFTGKEVVRVYAEADNLMYGKKIDDCGMLMLEFEDGIFASLDPSWSRPKAFPVWGDVTLEIVGEKGVISVDAMSQNIDVYSDVRGKHYGEYWGSNSDCLLVRYFVDVILFGREHFISGHDGMKAMEVALAAYRSAKLKRPVRIGGN